MTSSQTTLFAPSVADLMVQAYQRCLVKPSALTPQHLADGRLNANLLLAEWSNQQPHLWKVDLYDLALLADTAEYLLPAVTILTLDVYLRQEQNGSVVDRLIYPISRDDYASYPNKDMTAPPAVYWFDRLITPKITFYPTPDLDLTYTCRIYRVIQTDDANPAGAQTPDMPLRFQAAFVSGLAARLAETYAPEMYEKLEQRHKERYASAIIQDQEVANWELYPGISDFFR